MTDCIFCKIITQEIPSHVVFDGGDTLAFLDVHPTTKGHTLVIAKEHTANFLETTPETLHAISDAVQKIAPAIMQAVGAQGCNIAINNGAAAGQVIFHLHWHIIPRHGDDGLKPWPGKSYGEGEAARLAEAIRAGL